MRARLQATELESSVNRDEMNPAQLLNPKAFAKEAKKRRKQPNYGK